MLHIGVSILLAAPFFLFRDIPLFDLPIHIAQEHILFDPALAGVRQYYLYEWRLFPNMALDVMVYLLHFIFPLDLAIRIFLALIVLQLYWATLLLSYHFVAPDRSFGLAAALFVFNGPMMMGFIDLCFGLGMMIWVFALWLKWRDRVMLIPILAILSSLILTAHLFAFAVYGLAIVSYTVGDLFLCRDKRRRLTAILVGFSHLVLPLMLYRFAMVHNRAEANIIPSDILHKVWALLSLLGISDVLFNGYIMGIGIAGLILIQRYIKFAPEMWFVLTAFIGAFILLPHGYAQGSFVDYRIPTIFGFMLTAGVRWRTASPSIRVAEYGIIALLLVRLTILYGEWWSWEPTFTAYRAAFQLLPPGAKLLPIGVNWREFNPADRPPLTHMDALAVTERGAFVPTMLAGLPYQMIHYAPSVSKLRADLEHDQPNLSDYDYVLIVHPENNSVSARIEPIASGPDFLLARLLH